MGSIDDFTLPDAVSPDLRLSHPTNAEKAFIWNLTADAWQDSLPTKEDYLRECSYLTTVPLAKDGGMTEWILTDKNLPPNQRPILASCETFRKRSWVITRGDENELTETIAHAFANVYCDPKYRGRGYAQRMMRELARMLQNWQTETRKCVASALFSDIGKKYYSNLGWRPFPSFHISFDSSADILSTARPILAEDVGQLCLDDEMLCQKTMIAASSRSSSNDKKTIFMVVPDHDHMLWHHSKDAFTVDTLFQKKPTNKGAIAGEPGNRIWVIWTHRFYEAPEESTKNVLYILRLVVENQESLDNKSDETYELQAEQLKNVILAAQAEAAKWNLPSVRLWDPSPQIQELIKRTRIPHEFEEREEEGICSLLWYGEGQNTENSVEWLGKEMYGWC